MATGVMGPPKARSRRGRETEMGGYGPEGARPPMAPPRRFPCERWGKVVWARGAGPGPGPSPSPKGGEEPWMLMNSGSSDRTRRRRPIHAPLVTDCDHPRYSCVVLRRLVI